MYIPRFSVGDTLIMKKKHPCSSVNFKVLRIGSDIMIRCEGCGRTLTIAREVLEKSIKKVISSREEETKDGKN